MKKLFTLGFGLLFCSQLLSAQSLSKWTAASQAQLTNISETTTINVLVKTSADFDFSQYPKLKHTYSYGSIHSVAGSKEDLLELTNNKDVLEVEFGFSSSPNRVLDSISNQASFVYKVQSKLDQGISMPYAGKNVIVGIIDLGFQTDHPTMFDTLGTQFRVKRYWNQTSSRGNSPQPFGYGSLYSAESDIMYSDTDYFDTHGTHVTGIAGGSGFGSPNRNASGVAYESNLVLVNLRHKNDTINASAKGDYYVANPSILDGISYIFDYADSVGMPAVVNLSWGLHTGPHDGSSLFDQALDQLVGKGKIFVGSAGNSGFTLVHLGVDLKNDTIHTIAYDRIGRVAEKESIWVDSWGSPNSDYGVRLALCDTAGNILGFTDFILASSDSITEGILTVAKGIVGLDTLAYRVIAQKSFAGNSRPNLLIEAYNYSNKTRQIVLSFTSGNTYLHAWNSGNPNSWSEGGFYNAASGNVPLTNFIKGDGSSTVGENGGTGKRTVSVGAYAALSEWVNIDGDTRSTGHDAGIRAFFSSNGPTTDGRIKPDIMAPGVDIQSGINRRVYNPSDRSGVSSSVMFKGVENYYAASSGTSMSGPYVTGVVALMLQVNPDLTPEDVLLILHNSGEANNYTGTLPNNFYGYGILNAYKAVLLTLAPLSVDEESGFELKVYPNPSVNSVQVFHPDLLEGELRYSLYDLQGKVVQTGSTVDGKIQWENQKPGMYLLRFEDGSNTRVMINP